MDVEHPVAPARDKPAAQHPHEACEANQADVMGFQHLADVAIELLPSLEAAMVHRFCRNSDHPRALQSGGVRTA
jgi:hypothetical protein